MLRRCAGGAASLLMVSGCVDAGSTFGTGAAAGGHATSSRYVTNGGAGASNGGATSSGISASSTGSSSGSGSGGTSAGGCPAMPPTTLTDCAAGDVEIRASATDFCQKGAPLQTNITGYDLQDPNILFQSDSCGDIYLCVPAGTTVSMAFDVNDYWLTDYENLTGAHSQNIGPIPLFCSVAVESLTQMINAPPIDITAGLVDVAVVPSAACSAAGWSFALEDLAGNAIDAGVVYFNGTMVQPGTATTGDGLALLYNVDPAVKTVQVIGTHSGDAGCAVRYADYELAGTVPVAASTISFYPYPLEPL